MSQKKPSFNILLKSSWFSINRKYTYHEEYNYPSRYMEWSILYSSRSKDGPGLTLVNPNMKANWTRVNTWNFNETNFLT